MASPPNIAPPRGVPAHLSGTFPEGVASKLFQV